MFKNAFLANFIGNVAAINGIYTDAPECGSLVAAAENLSLLASMLPAESNVVAYGALYGDGKLLAPATVSLDGHLNLPHPLPFEYEGEPKWTFKCVTGAEYGVTLFQPDVTEYDDCRQWLIVTDEAKKLYASLLATAAAPTEVLEFDKPDLNEAFDNIDAAVFAGDGVTRTSNRAAARAFIARWLRELDRRDAVCNEIPLLVVSDRGVEKLMLSHAEVSARAATQRLYYDSLLSTEKAMIAEAYALDRLKKERGDMGTFWVQLIA